jgi:transketolase
MSWLLPIQAQATSWGSEPWSSIARNLRRSRGSVTCSEAHAREPTQGEQQTPLGVWACIQHVAGLVPGDWSIHVRARHEGFAMRFVYGETLNELTERDTNVMCLEADLSKASGTNPTVAGRPIDDVATTEPTFYYWKQNPIPC